MWSSVTCCRACRTEGLTGGCPFADKPNQEEEGKGLPPRMAKKAELALSVFCHKGPNGRHLREREFGLHSKPGRWRAAASQLLGIPASPSHLPDPKGPKLSSAGLPQAFQTTTARAAFSNL